MIVDNLSLDQDCSISQRLLVYSISILNSFLLEVTIFKFRTLNSLISF